MYNTFLGTIQPDSEECPKIQTGTENLVPTTHRDVAAKSTTYPFPTSTTHISSKLTTPGMSTSQTVHTPQLRLPTHLIQNSQSQSPTPSSQRARNLLHSLLTSPKCFSAVGTDGVLRLFDSKGNVIDFRRLSPEQIDDFMEYWVERVGEGEREFMREKYAGADGRLVSEECCLRHAREVLPEGMWEEKEARDERKSEFGDQPH